MLFSMFSQSLTLCFIALVFSSPVLGDANKFNALCSKTTDLRARIDDARTAIDGFDGGMTQVIPIARSLYGLEVARRAMMDHANQFDTLEEDEASQFMEHGQGLHDSAHKALESASSKAEIVKSLGFHPLVGGMVHGFASYVGDFQQLAKNKFPKDNNTMFDSMLERVSTQFSRTKAAFQ
ncbi:hypothetical protein EYZ11_009620 [Aspergillus tanneri]|uniref:Uncharacterized protein n=1 Tax=Aspergillus tanneri TaxID=1220188 RepID=A0A4S3J7M4_9EURO|nr:uncharacterized protein ATNIH1004_003389 [Aspergillus tanneri]KAA8650701.1 hypothetical protein ATNIH1004_003389 [Aspergillus tanneri]THC90920.1 hypothetical protein EYZ11_009620 [Aspergillus tanneri]